MTSVWRRLQLRLAGTTPGRRFQVRWNDYIDGSARVGALRNALCEL